MPPSLSQLREYGSEDHPIDLLDDEEADVPQQCAEVNNIIRHVRELALRGHHVVHIDEDEDENEDEDEPSDDDDDDDYDGQAQEDETDSDYSDSGSEFRVQKAPRRRGQNGRQRNPPLQGTHRLVSAWRVKDIDLKPDSFVELSEPLEICLIMGVDQRAFYVNAQFVQIKSIWVGRNNVRDIILRGLPYARNRNLGGRLEAKKNEICQILEVEDGDERPDEEQALVEVRPEQILVVRTLIMSNKPYGRENEPRFDPAYDTRQKIEDFAPLTCRWKMQVEYTNATKRKAGYSNEGFLSKLSEDEIPDEAHRVPDEELRDSWRGPSHITSGRPGSPYTFGDMFCGVGGVSRGAVMAGLKVTLAVDYWPPACDSYQLNFPSVLLKRQEMADFIQCEETNYQSRPVDFIHLSPPCQYFSPLAYQWAGRNDLKNMDALFACTYLIDKLRPRVFSLEQTFGITQPRHALFFNALIQGFTCHGYSVRWKVVCFRKYRLPSRRNRLIIIGACPGEKLPSWPPEHDEDVTEIQAIGHLRPGTDLHDVANARVLNNPPRDGNTPLGETICCSGPQKYQHYSGKRAYTLRELACLQGFPVEHRFTGNATAIKKQIGNAFAPCVAKEFLVHLRKHLERVDGVQPDPALPQPRPSRALPSPHSAGAPSGSRGRRGASGAGLEVQRDAVPQFSNYNGDFDDDEALKFALQESKDGMNGASRLAAPDTTHGRVQQGVIDLQDSSGDYEVQDSPVGRHVAPLVGHMSIASPRALSHAGHPCPAQSAPPPALGFGPRSRSATLDFSPGLAQKRSLNDVHDGAEGQAMKKRSPEKRERLHESGSADDNGFVVVDKIPSRLPEYERGRPQGSSDADSEEYVVVGQPSRSTPAAANGGSNQRAPSEELTWGDELSFKEALERRQRSSQLI